MLKVKNLTPQKLKKGGNFDHGCKKNRALLDFFFATYDNDNENDNENSFIVMNYIVQ